MAGAFSSLTFSSRTFDVVTVVTTGTNVLDNPVVSGQLDFDAPTNFGGVYFADNPLRGEVTVTGFVSPGVVRGYTSQPALAEITAEGFEGGIVTPISLNALTGEVSVEGHWPGTAGKPGGLLDNAYDPDGDPLSFQIMSLPAHGTLEVEFNGAFLYSPNRGFSGTDSFTWRPWANGEAGNTVTVTLLVEEIRQALTGEVDLASFAPTLANTGLNGAATLGEIGVTGFASTGLLAGFELPATLAEVAVVGATPSLETELQAIGSAVDVEGFAGTLVAGWVNRATTGAGVDPTSIPATLSIGFVGTASRGEITVSSFASANVGFVAQATASAVTVAGFASAFLELPLQAQLGAADVVGFAPQLSFEIILPPPAPERPSDVGFYDPRNHLPAGRRLDREIEDDLMEYWASVDYRVLTAGEIALICGSALPNPVMKREFGTGLYPVRKVG